MARRQLLEAGAAPSMINRRVASGHLILLHPGTYAVGHARLTRSGHWVAATLAAGPGAVLSHRDAAALHGLRPPGNHRRTHVTTPARAKSTVKLQLHRTSILDPRRDVTTVAGIPTTTVARTLVDLAGVVQQAQLAKAVDEAERQHLLDVRAIDDALRRTRQRRGPGHARLRAALRQLAIAGTQLTLSELEDRFLALLTARELPRPLTNHFVHGFKVDACWPDRGLVVELDGYAFHWNRRAFEHDRERANVLQANGWIVLRFTHGHVVRAPDSVARTIEAALARGVAPARGAARR